MDILILLSLILFVPLALFLGYLVLSSCLGDRLRARTRTSNPVTRWDFITGHGFYGKTYARNLAAGVTGGGWEGIEMDELFEEGHEDDGPLGAANDQSGD
ncbi:MAG: hypothetical protein M1831_001632 [Alyxoria varia]|nr:MAG: hypothetical protein M1831_001632 [Alyxoria varia]